jgi:hypothetical protein
MVMLSSRFPVNTSLTWLAVPNRGMRWAREVRADPVILSYFCQMACQTIYGKPDDCTTLRDSASELYRLEDTCRIRIT